MAYAEYFTYVRSPAHIDFLLRTPVVALDLLFPFLMSTAVFATIGDCTAMLPIDVFQKWSQRLHTGDRARVAFINASKCVFSRLLEDHIQGRPVSAAAGCSRCCGGRARYGDDDDKDDDFDWRVPLATVRRTFLAIETRAASRMTIGDTSIHCVLLRV